MVQINSARTDACEARIKHTPRAMPTETPCMEFRTHALHVTVQHVIIPTIV